MHVVLAQLCVVSGYGDASSGAYSYWTAALGNTPMLEAIKDNIMHGSTMWVCWRGKIGCKQASDQDSDASGKRASIFAYHIQATLTTCEKKMTLTNQKYCTTSLQSMVDYVTSELRTDAKAFFSTVPKETMMQEYVVSRVRKLGDGRSAAISCHKIGYPYTVFVCYKQAARTPYMVSLEAADGSKIKVAVLCHKDAPCRFLYQHDVLWVRN
ncbi:BURP domain-containing protein [Drosera capensis]